MNRPNIEAITARCEAATPGPWIWNPYDDVLESASVRDRVSEPTHDWELRAIIHSHAEIECDNNFIAAARTDIPELIAYIGHLEARLDDSPPWVIVPSSVALFCGQLQCCATKLAEYKYEFESGAFTVMEPNGTMREPADEEKAKAHSFYLGEIERQREEVARLKAENAALRKRLTVDDAMLSRVMGAKLPYPMCSDGCCTGTNLLTFDQAKWLLEAALAAE